MLAFTIPGKPQPKGRPRMGKGGRVFTPKETRAYEKTVQHFAKNAAGWFGPWPLEGEYRCTIDIYWPDKRRRDIDNAAKSILDGMNGVLWTDDSQVVELVLRRRLDRESPRAAVIVEVVS